MKALKIIGIIVGVVLLLFIAGGSYYGLFAKVVITKETLPAQTIYVTRHVGAYANVGTKVARLYTDIEDSCGLLPLIGVGVYYDNPQDVAIDSLRSFIGVQITPEEQATLAEFDLPYETITIPAMQAYVAQFPFKGMPSLILAISRVYPKLHAYLNEKEYKINTPTLEVYDQTAQEIRMIVPIDLTPEVYAQWWEPTVVDTVAVDTVTQDVIDDNNNDNDDVQ